MSRILVIEDDRKLNLLMREFLMKYNYEVIQIRNFREVEKEIIEAEPDLILLDITLPYLDGFYLCRYIRKKLSVPIIIVSSRNSDMDQIMGLELGADDYLVKPFQLELLQTKIKATLRRAYGEYAKSKLSSGRVNTGSHMGHPELINSDGLLLNPNNFKMAYKGKEVELSKNEFKLMRKLFENSNVIMKREELLMELWDDQTFVEDNTLTVNITRLKGKLEELGICQAIKTVRGVGYLLEWESKAGGYDE